MTWFRITLPYATYGVRVHYDLVTEAAPIAQWMIGKQWSGCVDWLTRKGATIEPLNPRPRPRLPDPGRKESRWSPRPPTR